MPSEARADLEKIKISHRRTFPWPRRTLIQRSMLQKKKKNYDDFGPVVQESTRSNNATSIIARVSVRSMDLPRVLYAIQSFRIRHPGSVRAIMLRYYPLLVVLASPLRRIVLYIEAAEVIGFVPQRPFADSALAKLAVLPAPRLPVRYCVDRDDVCYFSTFFILNIARSEWAEISHTSAPSP